VAGEDLLLSEAYDIVDRFTTVMGDNKEIIFGLRIEPTFQSRIRICSIITGIDILSESSYEDFMNLTDGVMEDPSIFEEIESIPTLK